MFSLRKREEEIAEQVESLVLLGASSFCREFIRWIAQPSTAEIFPDEPMVRCLFHEHFSAVVDAGNSTAGQKNAMAALKRASPH